MSDLLRLWQGLGLLAQGFVVLLLLILGVATLRYIFPLFRLRSQVDGATRKVRRFTTEEPRSGMISAYHLRDTWNRFAEEWGHHAIEIGGTKGSVVDPEDFFRSRSLLIDRGRAIPAALPGVFVGLGILGTFLGLLVGLGAIETGRTDDPDALIRGVEGLLGGMSTAFVSSILGIALSLGWLLGYRWLLADVDRRLERFAAKVRERFPTWMSADLLRFTIEEQNREREREERRLQVDEEQKAILQNLGTDIAESLEHAMASALQEGVTPALSELTNSFSALGEDIRAGQMEGVSEMAAEFQKQLMEAVEKDFGRLSESLSQAAEVQERTASSMGGFLTRLEAASTEQTELLEATALASEQFTESVQGLAEVHGGIKESVPALRAAHEDIGRTANDLRVQSELLDDANSRLREALAEQLDAVQRQVETLSGFWENFGADLGTFQTELADSIQEFRNVAAERLSDVFRQFDAEMAKVVQHLSGTLAELREVSQDLPEQVRGIRGSVDTFRETAASTREPMTELVQVLDRTGPVSHQLGKLQERSSEVVSTMKELQVALSKALDQARDGEGDAPVAGTGPGGTPGA